MKKFLQIFVMLSALFFISGCGSNNIMNTYSFGQQIVHNGQSYVQVTLPFEIGEAKPSSVAQKNGELHPNTVYYQGQDKRFIIFITGIALDMRKALPDVTSDAVQDVKAYENNQKLSDVKLSVVPDVLGGVPAMKISGTYVNGNLPMGLQEYLFIDRGVLWRIQYLYNPKDQESVDLVKYIDGKIKFIK